MKQNNNQWNNQSVMVPQSIFFQSTTQKRLNTYMCLSLLGVSPFSSLKVRDRGAGVCKAIVDATILT